MKRLKSKPARKESQRRKKYVHSNKGRTDETRRPPKTGFPSEVGFRPWTTSRKTQNLDLKGFMVSKIENLWWIGDQIWGTIFEKIRGPVSKIKDFWLCGGGASAKINWAVWEIIFEKIRGGPPPKMVSGKIEDFNRN